MSVAIVAMVNHTAIALDDHSDSDDVDITECGVSINDTVVSYQLIVWIIIFKYPVYLKKSVCGHILCFYNIYSCSC